MLEIKTLPKPNDPGASARGMERWNEAALRAPDPRTASFAMEFAKVPEGRSLLEAVFGNSPYLSQIAVREQQFLMRLVTQGFDAAFDALLGETVAEFGAVDDTARLMTGLRVAKRRAALLIALADIGNAWSLERITAALSDVAETAVRLAVGHLLRKLRDTGKLELPDPPDPTVGSGVVVLAMGKLGARELNYSSDIDLIVFYDDGVVRMAEPDTMAPTFSRFARDLVRIMEERTKDGYVFRTDLRLRPDPGATPPAVSFSAAEAYYGSLGQNWERAAMIKARQIAGDSAAGAQFMQMIRPFVWRRNLDFAAIQDIHSIKRQINAHRGYRTTAVNGHNVKLGRGGIREIEFYAQTQQLIFGGRDVGLRRAPTCVSLRALVDAGHVDAKAADDLTAAYGFLRRVEHRLQMIDDQQTHSLPDTDEGVAALATFLGYESAATFRQEMLGHLDRVADRYATLFEEAPPLTDQGNLVFTGAEDDPDTIATLKQMGFGNPGSVAAAVRAWHHGRYRATRSTRARELLTELAPTLLRALAGTPNPDGAFVMFDAFLARLPAGVQLFSLFYANPKLLDLVAEIMGAAPRLATVLSRHPSQLDSVLTPGFFGALPDADTLKRDLGGTLGQARDFEDVLNLCRRWTNDQKFRAGVHILRGITDGDRCGPFLADIADASLEALATEVERQFAERHGRFAGAGMSVVAMGKLGGRQMSINSDVDLITIYDLSSDQTQSDGAKPLSPTEYYIKLTQRLVNAITSATSEGRLYEVDMRLRPSGNAGPLATSLEAFTKYQTNQAWTWEHMALTRARPISGDAAFRRRIVETIRGILTTPRDERKLVTDIADMRRRIDREFGTKNPWDLKYFRGGFIDIEFIAQYLMLRHGASHPEILSTNTLIALEKISMAGHLDPSIAAELTETLRLWRRVQGFLRLTMEDKFSADGASAGLRAGIARAALANSRSPDDTPIDFALVETKIRDAAERAYDHFKRLIDEPAAEVASSQTREP